MTDHIINWSSEIESARAHLSKGGRSLHVRGSAETRSAAFLERIVDEACESGYRVACMVDPDSILTGTPPAALQELSRNLGVPSPVRRATPVRIEIGNKARVGGNLDLHDVHIDTVIDESEATAELLIAIREEVSKRRRFDKSLIIFRECHRMSDELRVKFVSNFWEPLIAKMVKKGAVAIFQYAPHELSTIGTAVPIVSANHIDMPHRFGHQVAAEVAAVALAEGWEASEETAMAAARTALTLSTSVSQLYDNLLSLELNRATS